METSPLAAPPGTKPATKSDSYDIIDLCGDSEEDTAGSMPLFDIPVPIGRLDEDDAPTPPSEDEEPCDEPADAGNVRNEDVAA